MKLSTFTIVKKNHKYFACKFESGAPFKLVIDSNSESLEPGEHTLRLDDQSIRTSYGTNLIFAAHDSEQNRQGSSGICTLKADYNSVLVKRCQELGGKWDHEQKVWVFSDLIADEVEELEYTYTHEITAIEVTALDDIEVPTGPIHVAGYPLARAQGRDTGATLSDGVSMVAGRIVSGGSVKNWLTMCPEGTTFRLRIPAALIDDIDTREWSIKKL